MLLGNYSVLLKSPAQFLAGSTLAGQRANFNSNAQERNFYVGWATVQNVTIKSSKVSGYDAPYAWVLAGKSGGLASFGRAQAGLLLSGGLSQGRAISADLVASATITSASLALVVSLAADLLASVSLSATMLASANLISSLTASGSLTAALSELANMVATLTASASVSNSNLNAIGHLSADLVFGPSTELSPAALAAAVWDSVAADFDAAGSMGEKMNDAGSASNPWSDTTQYGAGTKGKLLQDSLSVSKFLGLK